jgi:hypothetical protein
MKENSRGASMPPSLLESPHPRLVPVCSRGVLSGCRRTLAAHLRIPPWLSSAATELPSAAALDRRPEPRLGLPRPQRLPRQPPPLDPGRIRYRASRPPLRAPGFRSEQRKISRLGIGTGSGRGRESFVRVFSCLDSFD